MAFQPGTVSECYFPPCRQEPEFPLRGTLAGATAGSTLAMVDELGQSLTTATVAANGDFVLAAPASRGKGPYKICYLGGKGTRPVCGPVGVPAPKFEVGGSFLQVIPKPVPLLPKPILTRPALPR